MLLRIITRGSTYLSFITKENMPQFLHSALDFVGSSNNFFMSLKASNKRCTNVEALVFGHECLAEIWKKRRWSPGSIYDTPYPWSDTGPKPPPGHTYKCIILLIHMLYIHACYAKRRKEALVICEWLWLMTTLSWYSGKLQSGVSAICCWGCWLVDSVHGIIKAVFKNSLSCSIGKLVNILWQSVL